MKKQLLSLAFFGVAAISANAQTANLQVIHNCPDPGAAVVDVWVDNTLLLDNFNYKEATPYIPVPAGANFDVTIAGPTSTDTTNAVFRKTFNLMSGAEYVVVASGGLAESNTTAFDLRAFAGQSSVTTAGNTSVKVFHGAYDAPMVDVYETSVPAGVIVDDISFGEDQGYLDLASIDYGLQIRLNNLIAVAEFGAPLSAFADSSLVVLATGYLDPSSAVGVEPFGLMAVTSGGVVVPLPSQAITPAKLQVIHNCAATDASSVDVWLNDGPLPLIDDFMFRTASAFIDAPAGSGFDVSIALPTSVDTAGALFRQTFVLESGQNYIVVASGTVGSGTYMPATPFSLEVITDARINSTNPVNVDVAVWHGATDAPMVDVEETYIPAGVIVDDISYGEVQGYLELGEANYILDVVAGGNVVASYNAPLADLQLAGNAITVLASGFLDPSMNNNGPAFGLWAATPNGGPLVQLPITTGMEETLQSYNVNLFPNPAQDFVRFNGDFTGEEELVVEVISVDGKIVYRAENVMVTGQSTDINVSALDGGAYLLRLSTPESSVTKRFIVRR